MGRSWFQPSIWILQAPRVQIWIRNLGPAILFNGLCRSTKYFAGAWLLPVQQSKCEPTNWNSYIYIYVYICKTMYIYVYVCVFCLVGPHYPCMFVPLGSKVRWWQPPWRKRMTVCQHQVGLHWHILPPRAPSTRRWRLNKTSRCLVSR